MQVNNAPVTSDEGVFRADEGDSMSFQFTTKGSPAPNVVWKNGTDVIEPSDDVFIETTKGRDETTSSLILRNVKSTDSGTYSAEGDNGEGTVARSSVDVSVRCECF